MAEGFQFKLHFSLNEGAVEEVGLVERRRRDASDTHAGLLTNLWSPGQERVVADLIQHLRDEGYSVSPPCNQNNNVIINNSDFFEGQDSFRGSFVSQTRQSPDQDDISRIEAEIEGSATPNRTEGRYRIILDYFYDADKGQQPIGEKSVSKLLRLLDTSQEGYGKDGHAAVLKELKPLLRSIFDYLMNLKNRRAPKPLPRKVKVHTNLPEKVALSDSDSTPTADKDKPKLKKVNLTFEDLGPSSSGSSGSSDSELDRVVNMVVKMRESERLMFKPGGGLVSISKLKNPTSGVVEDDQEDSDSSRFGGREKTMSAYSRSLSVYADDYAVGRSSVADNLRTADEQETTAFASEPHSEGTSKHRYKDQEHHAPQTPSSLNKEVYLECVDENADDGADDQETTACIRDPLVQAEPGHQPNEIEPSSGAVDALKKAVCEDPSCVSGPLKTWTNDGGRQDGGSAMSTNTTSSHSVELAIDGATDSKEDTPVGLTSSQPLIMTPLAHKKESRHKELTVLVTTPESVDSQVASSLAPSQKEASPNVNTVGHSATHPLEIRSEGNLTEKPQVTFLATQPTTPESMPNLTGSPLPTAQTDRPTTGTVPNHAVQPVAGKYEDTFTAENFLPDSFGRVVGETTDAQRELRAQSISLVEMALGNALGLISGKKGKQLEANESTSTLVTAPEGGGPGSPTEGCTQFDIDVQVLVEGTTVSRLIKTCPMYPLRDDLTLKLKEGKGKVTVFSEFKNLDDDKNSPSGSMPSPHNNNTSAFLEDHCEGHNSILQRTLTSHGPRTDSRSDDFMGRPRCPRSEAALNTCHVCAIHDTGEGSLLSTAETESLNSSKPTPRRRRCRSILRSSASDCAETCLKRDVEFSAKFLARLANIRFSSRLFARGCSAPHGAGGLNNNNNAVYKVEGDTYYVPPRCRCSEARRDHFFRWCKAFEECLKKKGLQGAKIEPGSKKTHPNLPLTGWPLRRCHSTCTRLFEPMTEACGLFRPYWSTHRNVYEPDHCLLRHKRCTNRNPPPVRARRPTDCEDSPQPQWDPTPDSAPCPPLRRTASQPSPAYPPHRCTLDTPPVGMDRFRVGDGVTPCAADCNDAGGMSPSRLCAPNPACGPATEPPSTSSFHTADADMGSFRCHQRKSAPPSPCGPCRSPRRHPACSPPPPVKPRRTCAQESALRPLKEVAKCVALTSNVVDPCASRLDPSAQTRAITRTGEQVRGAVPRAVRESRPRSVCKAEEPPRRHTEPAGERHALPQATKTVANQGPDSVRFVSQHQSVIPADDPPKPKSRSRQKQRQPGAVKPRTRSLTAGEGPCTLPSWKIPKPIARSKPCLDSFLQCRLQHDTTCYISQGRSVEISRQRQTAVTPHSTPVSPSLEQAAPSCQLKHYILPSRSPNPYLDRLWQMTNSACPTVSPTSVNGSNYHLSRNPVKDYLHVRRSDSRKHPQRRNSSGDSKWRTAALNAEALFESLCVYVVEQMPSKAPGLVRLRPRTITTGSPRRAVSADGTHLVKMLGSDDTPGSQNTHAMLTSVFGEKRLRNAQSHDDLTGS
ncbi:hypothetical protein AAHC03_012847 [Spirometra sp. Aus1]